MSTVMERTIAIIFAGDDRTQAAFSSVSSNLSDFKGKIEDAAAKLAGVTDTVLKLDAAIMAMAAAGIAYSVYKFQEFEDVMLKVKGIMGASESQYIQLTNLTKELGATTRFTATEAAQGLEFLALAGFDFEASMSALPDVLNLAQAAAMDLGTAADIVTNIMAGYGIEIRDLTATTDVLTATFTNSNTNLAQLGDAFKYVGPIANALNMDIEETAAILGILGNAGYQAEQGGTALRNILLALVAPTGDAQKLFEKLGINTDEFGISVEKAAQKLKAMGIDIKDAEGNLRPFPEIMGMMQKSLERIPDPADRAAVLIDIFGKRAGPAMAALLEQGAGSVVDLEAKIRSLGGVTAEIAEMMESGMGGALRSLKSAFESVAIDAGERFSEGLVDPINSAAELFRAIRFEINAGAFDPVFAAFNHFAQFVGGQLEGIAKALPEALSEVSFDAFVDALGDLGRAIMDTMGNLDLTQPEDLALALQKAVDILTGLVRVTEGMIDAFRPFIQQIAEFFIELSRGDEEAQKFAGQILAYAKIIATAGLEITAALVTMQQTGTGWAEAFKVTGESARIVWETFTLTVRAAALAVVDLSLVVNQLLYSMSFGFGTFYAQNIAQLNEWRQNLEAAIAQDAVQFGNAVLGLGDALLGMGSDAQEGARRVDSLGQSSDEAARRMIELKSQLWSLGLAIDDIPAGVEIEIFLKEWNAIRAQLWEVGRSIDDIPKEVMIELVLAKLEGGEAFDAAWEQHIGSKDGTEVTVGAGVDYSSLIQAEEDLDAAFPMEKPTHILPDVDKPSAEQAAKVLDVTAEPRTAVIEVESDDHKLEELKMKFDLLKESMNLKVQLEIAEVEANAQIVTAAFGTLASAFDSSGQVISSAIDAYAQTSDDLFDLTGKRSFLEDVIKQELALREKSMNITSDLIYTQIQYMQEKIRQMQRGEALIQIDGAGLQPHLEAFMWEILSAIQMRVNEEGHAMLFGM